jgi:xylulose-5-phosphate/fructose-6-phosphate phosphoketolase
VPGLAERTSDQQRELRRLLVEHKLYITEHGDDMPMVRDWRWE